MPRIAVVTGSNKGIGNAIVKGLCETMDDALVYLAARNPDLGPAAVHALQAALGPVNGAKLRYHQLDITDAASCRAFGQYVEREHGGLDVLVNNAAVATKDADPEPFGEKARYTMHTNYFGTRQVCDALLPLLKPGARVVNVAGVLGMLSNQYSAENRALLKSPDLTYEQLDALVHRYVESAQRGEQRHRAAGFPTGMLGFSKAAVLAMTAIQHRQLAGDPARPGIVVNAFCPGWTLTDMNRHTGMGGQSTERGADTGVYLATLPQGRSAFSGQFLKDRRPVQW